MKIKTKLIIGLGSIISIILILSTTVFYTLTTQNSYLRDVVMENYERVSVAEQLKYETNTIVREVRELLLSTSESDVNEKITIINQSETNLKVLFDRLQRTESFDMEKRILVSSIHNLHESYVDMIQNVISLVTTGNEVEARSYLLQENQELRKNMIEEVDEFAELEEQAMMVALSESEEAYQNAVIFLVVFIGAALLLIIFITYSIVKSISKSINNVSNVMKNVSTYSTTHLPRIDVTTKDEIGDIARAYNAMAESLEIISKQEKQVADALKEENWIKSRYAELAMKFQGIKELNEFGKTIMTNIAQFVKATYGVIYIKDEGRAFRKIAAYAREDKDVGVNQVQFGQGLVGQCAEDNKMMHIDHLPQGYITTSSGLGAATPSSLILIPIEFEGDVLGVIELAKFEPFSHSETRILEQLSRASGTSIERILDHMKIEELLVESQTQSEELQTQSEELQQQQEELRLINEQLQEQYKQLDEKAKELELIKKDLEEKNRNIKLGSRYKSEFLANMSHELRTPLNSLLILSQMLAENAERNLTAKQIDHAATIYASGRDLLDLINDILDLSKIESGKIDVYAEEVLISDVKAFVERQFAPVSNQKGVEFKLKVDSDTPTILFTDDQRLKQILKNLLSNAFKFTTKGCVELHIKKGKEEDGFKVVFSVIDTGIGISKEKQKSIFEAFYQEDGTTSRKYGGTGLGLSISRELSELLGGYIRVESIEGNGSTFTLYLSDYDGYVDLAMQEVAGTVEGEAIVLESDQDDAITKQNSFDQMDIQKETIQEQLSNKMVLVVDDDMRNVFALTTALEKQKMKVVFAENGKEALEVLENHTSIDIILMDIMMPEMNGYETMQAIRKEEKWADLPILALTAKAMKSDKEKCINAGASDYISKPVNMEQLLSLIKVWLHK
ncbi:response regulator [Halalkalibacter kiskunsagensis]|uniref:histidine kinase n=1 Tax=Halalkalibacter kiskunsagensis TaxID=1548599 RepID=A0ABV6KFJ7_9BACI